MITAQNHILKQEFSPLPIATHPHTHTGCKLLYLGFPCFLDYVHFSKYRGGKQKHKQKPARGCSIGEFHLSLKWLRLSQCRAFMRASQPIQAGSPPPALCTLFILPLSSPEPLSADQMEKRIPIDLLALPGEFYPHVILLWFCSCSSRPASHEVMFSAGALMSSIASFPDSFKACTCVVSTQEV